MAEAVLVDTANAARELVKDHDFGLPFESKLSYADATKQLEQITELQLDFVPWRSPLKSIARGIFEYQCDVDVIARKKFKAQADTDQVRGHVEPSEINRLLKFMQDVEEFFIQSGRELTLASGGWKARLQKTDKKLDYSRPHLYTNSQFTGWIRVTYLAAKQI